MGFLQLLAAFALALVLAVSGVVSPPDVPAGEQPGRPAALGHSCTCSPVDAASTAARAAKDERPGPASLVGIDAHSSRRNRARRQDQVLHVVSWGETLFSIARRYGTTVEAIAAANGIVSPAQIYAGQRLVIPGTGAPVAAPGSAGTHVVQPGENLYRIALRYGMTVDSLAQANGIHNVNHVWVGQRLVIPSATGGAPAGLPPVAAGATHVVQAGEVLSAIAVRYGLTSWALAQANGIANPGLIYPGQVLVIPQGGGTVPAGAGGGQRIVIDLSEQHLYAYQDGVLVYSFVASTGMPGAATAVGTFQVLDKIPNAYAYTWNLQMPYWLGIYWAGSLENGIHALPILPNGQQLWAGYLGTPVSFGCIILGTAEARMLYEWAQVGAPVIVQY